MSKKIDLTGKRFGRLIVVKDSGERLRKYIVWECLCDCGNKRMASTGKLQSGYIQSCGCLRKEQSLELVKLGKEHNQKNELVEGTFLPNLSMKKRKDNTSGYKGISRDRQRGKWETYIQLEGKKIFLGRFDKLEDAVETRKEAEEKYFIPILEKYGRLEVTK